MPEMVLRTALYLRNASFHFASLESGFVNIRLCDKTGHLPSRSISKTLMASCVLSGRTSLAGSVCLLWIPGETEGAGCIGLMKGCEPTTDIIWFETLSLSPPQKIVGSCLLSPLPLGRITSGPCEDKRMVCAPFYRTALPAVIHRLICI